MRSAVEVLATFLVATMLFAVAHLVLRPAPVPALVGLAGGLVAYWAVSPPRLVVASVGWAVGTLIGTGLHFVSHGAEDRMSEPAEGMALHLVLDCVRGMLVSAPILAISISRLLGRWVGRR